MIIERTKNSIRNVIWGFVNKIVALVFPFVIRTVIIYVLGSEYLGLSSLFTSILQVLSLAELGFSSAIVYSMYEPIAKDDKKTICALMRLYKNIYRAIGLIVLIIGLGLAPFLKYLVKTDSLMGLNIYILYAIYLGNSVVSYFLFAYKNCLLSAHQRLDVVSNINTVLNLLMYSAQIAVLLLFKNYYLFAILIPISTISINVINAIYAAKMYPQYKCEGTLEKERIREIKKQVVGLMMNKVCQVSRNSLDSIIISAFLGLTVVAMYNNYYYILGALNGIMSIISNAILAGVGNSVSVESKEKNYRDMSKFLFLYMWIAGWTTCCLASLYQPFMNMWVGRELMLSMLNMFLFCLYYYCLQMGVIRAVYYDAAGLWWYGKFRAFSEAILNIILNIVLGKFFGITGIIIATLISLVLINYIYGSHLLFKYYFTSQNVMKYFADNGLYMIVTSVVLMITYLICNYIPFGETRSAQFGYMFIRVGICIVVPNTLYVVIYRKNKQFMEAKKWAVGLARSKLRRS